MPAMDAYRKKLILVEDLGTQLYEEMVQARIESERGDRSGRFYNTIPSPGMWSKTDTGASVVGRMRAAINLALPFWVAPQMHELITAAAESMPNQAITEADLPSAQGLLTIPGGIATIDVRGQLLSYDSVLWDQTDDGVNLYWMVDKYDEKDTTNRMLRSMSERYWVTLPELTIGQTMWLRFGKPVPDVLANGMVVPPELQNQVYLDSATGNIMMNHVKGYTEDELRDLVQPKIRPDAVSMWLIACWRLMSQTITTVESEDVPRGIRRQAERRGMRDRNVTVVNLRRRSVAGSGGGTPVEWSHRWLVRGHWRDQRYKGDDGEWFTKPLWIHPHLKGPDDKPLHLREHVYALTR